MSGLCIRLGLAIVLAACRRRDALVSREQHPVVIQTVFKPPHLGELADVLNDLFGSEAEPCAPDGHLQIPAAGTRVVRRSITEVEGSEFPPG
jgi:hypothetical protein